MTQRLYRSVSALSIVFYDCQPARARDRAMTNVGKAKRRQAAALHRAPGAPVDGKKGTSAEECVAWVLRRHIYWRGFAAVGVFEDGRPDRSRDSPATAVSCAWSG